MFVVYEDSGDLLCGRVLTRSEKSLMLELATGKREKIKIQNALLEFQDARPEEVFDRARVLSADMDANLVWECADEADFNFVDIAKEYYPKGGGIAEQLASLYCLFASPHYFKRLGAGKFKKASQQTVQAALLAIEKKRIQNEQIDFWAQELIRAICPIAIQLQMYKLLFKPDKNTLEYKAVQKACKELQKTPIQLFQDCSAITSSYEFHWQKFLIEYFPQGLEIAAQEGSVQPNSSDTRNALELADVQAFSIDDSQTTEIDDALSLQGLGSGTVVLGIHIAAPAYHIAMGDAIDQVASQRMSTVYAPGQKIMMLPSEVVDRHSLFAGHIVPVLSLYARIDESSFELLHTQTRLEKVKIDKNLRHDQLEDLVTQEWLAASSAKSNLFDEDIDKSMQNMRGQLSFLYQWALHRKHLREQVRGQAEANNRADYVFRIDAQSSEIKGDEPIIISKRARNDPLNVIVAESMIFANASWGKYLADHGVPGVYRSQASLAFGSKVRMSTHALPHAGLGVQCYAWCTSPLRRYIDLINQWQLIACAQHGNTAGLTAPFIAGNANLLALIARFEAVAAAYNDFQTAMECYWTMKYIEQQQLTHFHAVVINERLARLLDLPLLIPTTGIQGLARGQNIRVQLKHLDLFTLEASAHMIEQLEGSDTPLEALEADAKTQSTVHSPTANGEASCDAKDIQTSCQ